MINSDELKSFLATENVCIVHFSHHAKMREGGVFPNDLQAAITNCKDWNLSCCALWPGHKMALPGDVGVLFELDHPRQILSVCSDDAGASQTQDGKDQSAGFKPDLTALAKSLNVTSGSYNEWRVIGAKVAGIYVEKPDRIQAKRRVKFEVLGEEIEEISSETIQLECVKANFPNWKVLTFQNGCLVEI
jgi:hypothetical protein